MLERYISIQDLMVLLGFLGALWLGLVKGWQFFKEGKLFKGQKLGK